jgi:hypothetical protein
VIEIKRQIERKERDVEECEGENPTRKVNGVNSYLFVFSFI